MHPARSCARHCTLGSHLALLQVGAHSQDRATLLAEVWASYGQVLESAVHQLHELSLTDQAKCATPQDSPWLCCAAAWVPCSCAWL